MLSPVLQSAIQLSLRKEVKHYDIEPRKFSDGIAKENRLKRKNPYKQFSVRHPDAGSLKEGLRA